MKSLMGTFTVQTKGLLDLTLETRQKLLSMPSCTEQVMQKSEALSEALVMMDEFLRIGSLKILLLWQDLDNELMIQSDSVDGLKDWMEGNYTSDQHTQH